MNEADWLVMLDSDGRVTGIGGGAPNRWLGRCVHECLDLPERVQDAAREIASLLEARLGASPISLWLPTRI